MSIPSFLVPTLTLAALTLLPAQAPAAQAPSLPGEAGENRAAVDPDPEVQLARARARYVKVQEELAGSDLSHLTAEQRSERAYLLSVLRGYGQVGSFGVNREFPGARMPHFVDADGRRCAVAELLHASGEDELVDRVARTANTAWVVDLSAEPSFLDWLERSGLSLDEAARIQGPPMLFNPPAPPYDGPEDTTPTPGGDDPAPARPSTPGASQPGPAGPGAVSPGPSHQTPQPWALPLTGEAQAWWTWWEYNKAEFLRPNRLDMPAFPSSGDDPESALVRGALSLRRMVTAPLIRSLSDPDARVRASAAVSVGRVGREEAVQPLLEMLADRSVSVREHALLGLGATGAPEARTALLTLAREGQLRGDRVSRNARALAIVALGLGRRAGFEATLDVEIVRLVQRRRLADRETVGGAAMAYHLLAPSAATHALALELAADDDEPISVRARAIEALRGATDNDTLSALQHVLNGRRLDLRRSAALAMGEVANPLALPALMTAHDLEREPLTRGFLLISIGRQGGAAARGFLLDELSEGADHDRPWAALALGLWSRDQDDPRVLEVLRASAGAVRDRSSIGAYWLALGLARDVVSTETLAAALGGKSDPRTRSYAAYALAMIGTDEARTVLLERLTVESSSMASAAIGLSLGIVGAPEDAGRLLDLVETMRVPELQGQAATAVAFHGSSEGFHGLGRLSSSSKTGDLARSAAIQGLGMQLSSTPVLSMAELSRSANFANFGDWLSVALQTTL